MPLLIDTYNVLHTVGILPPELAGIEVDGLVKLLQASRYRDEKTTLVCDGAPQLTSGERPVMRIGSITIRYSGKGNLADDLISALIRASTAPRSLVVISSDHEVQKAARKRRCRILTSEEFLRELASDAQLAPSPGNLPRKPIGSMSDEQIDRWVNVFKLDDKTLSIPSRGVNRSNPPPLVNEPIGDLPVESDAPQPPAHRIKPLARGEGLPEDFIEQAERLWNQENPHAANNNEDR